MRTGITGEQAQDMMEKARDDFAAIEEAARSLATQELNFSNSRHTFV